MANYSFENFSVHCQYGTFTYNFSDSKDKELEKQWTYTLKPCEEKKNFKQFLYLHHQFVEIHGLYSKNRFIGNVYNPLTERTTPVSTFLDLMSLQLKVMEREIRDEISEMHPELTEYLEEMNLWEVDMEKFNLDDFDSFNDDNWL